MADLATDQLDLIINQLLEGKIEIGNSLYLQLVQITGEEPNKNLSPEQIKKFFLARLIIEKEILREGISKEQLKPLIEEYEKHLQKQSEDQIKIEIRQNSGQKYVQNIIRQAETREANLREFVETEQKETERRILKAVPVEKQVIYTEIFKKVLNETGPVEEIKKEAEKMGGERNLVEELVINAEKAKDKKEVYKRVIEEARELTEGLSTEENIKPKIEDRISKTIYKSIIGEDIDDRILKQEIIKTIEDNNLVEVSKTLQTEIEIGVIKLKTETNSFVKQNEEKITSLRKDALEQEILKSLQKNPNISENQFKEYCIPFAKSASEILAGGPIIDNYKEEIFKKFSDIDLKTKEEIWAQVGVLQRVVSKNDLYEIYKQASKQLRGNIPFDIAQIRALEKLRSHSDFEKIIQRMRRQYGYSNYFSNFLRQQGLNFGSQNLRNFLQNSFSFLKNGNFSLAGLKSFFAKSTIGIGTKAALATTPWGAMALVAKSLLSKLGGGVKDFLRETGLNITDGLKKFLGETFGIAGSFVSSFIETTEDVFQKSISLIVIVLFCVISGIFLTGCRNSKIGVSLTSTIGWENNFITGDYTPPGEQTPISCKENYTKIVKTYKSNDLTLYVFEAGSKGGRMTQRYDIGRVDPKELGLIDGFDLDKRVIEAYVAMRKAFEQIYPKSNDLTLTSGYRSIAKQQGLYNDKYQETKNNHPDWTSSQIENYTRTYVAAPGCSPHHTGRAIDILVNGSAGDSSVYSQQRLSNTFQWLINNAAKYGFYNYINEPWHWEYNPPDLNL